MRRLSILCLAAVLLGLSLLHDGLFAQGAPASQAGARTGGLSGGAIGAIAGGAADGAVAIKAQRVRIRGQSAAARVVRVRKTRWPSRPATCSGRDDRRTLPLAVPPSLLATRSCSRTVDSFLQADARWYSLPGVLSSAATNGAAWLASPGGYQLLIILLRELKTSPFRVKDHPGPSWEC